MVVIQYALSLVALACALAAWVVIVITGRLPAAINDGLELGLAYQAKSLAYLLLLTETWPPFSGNRARLFPESASTTLGPGGAFAPPTARDRTERPGGLEG